MATTKRARRESGADQTTGEARVMKNFSVAFEDCLVDEGAPGFSGAAVTGNLAH